MSLTAINENGDKVMSWDVGPGNYECLVCHEKVIWKKTSRWPDGSEWRCPHFAHLPNKASTCPERAGEGPEHLAMKEVFLRAYPGSREVVLETGRRADLVIACPDGIERTVECQVSPIDLVNVSGRIKDHNAAGYPVAWALAPARIKQHNLPITDGVTEALDPADWSGISVSRDGKVQSAHVFYDSRCLATIDTPEIVFAPIDLRISRFKDSSVDGRNVSVFDVDTDRVRWEWDHGGWRAGRGLAFDAVRGFHLQTIDRMDTAKERAGLMGEKDNPIVWREYFKAIVKDNEETGSAYGSIPHRLTRRGRLIWCDRVDREVAERIARAERANMFRMREEERRRSEAERIRLTNQRAEELKREQDEQWRRLYAAQERSERERAERTAEEEAKRQARAKEFQERSEYIEALKEQDRRERVRNIKRMYGLPSDE